MDDPDLSWLVARVAIEELTAQYNRAFDDVDLTRWCDTFADDGTMSLNGRQWRGREALAGLARRIGFGMVHVTTNAVVTVEGDSATQECSLLLLRRHEQRRPVELLTTGRYSDELVRTSDGWRFARRNAVTDSDL